MKGAIKDLSKMAEKTLKVLGSFQIVEKDVIETPIDDRCWPVSNDKGLIKIDKPRLVLCNLLIHSNEARTLDEQFEVISRNKRYLTYTSGSAIGMFLAFAVPLELEGRDVLFSYNFEANYNLPTNTSQYDLSPPNRSFLSYVNRTYIYNVIKARLNNFGLEGQDCLLRTICEASRAPIDHNGIMGYFLHILFTPSTSESENLDDEEEAENKGRNTTEECIKLYKCPFDLLDLISYYDS